jgi:uncharacterized protein DUF3224
MTTERATGTFHVKLVPLDPLAPDAPLARLSIDKRFHGELEATAVGQMLSIGTEVPGSAGYVAMERVTGSLRGKSGSFAMLHAGTMDRGQPRLSVNVVPDSGTDELKGLSGTFSIRIEGGQHFYEFDYVFQATT